MSFYTLLKSPSRLAMYIVQCTLYTVQCTLYSVSAPCRCTVCSVGVKRTVYSVKCKYKCKCKVLSDTTAHCTVSCVQSNTVHCKLYALYSVQCRLLQFTGMERLGTY